MLTLGQETIYMGTAAPSGGGGSGDAVWGAITGTLSNQTDLQTALNAKANSADLATVATSGSYNDLSNKPTIPTVIPADNSTITENASNELQTVGVINHNTANDATNPLKFWEGTEQEWEVGGITDTYYAWKGAGISPDEHSTYSTTYGAVFSGAYGDGKFVMVAKNSRDYSFSYYSTDGGNTWTYKKPITMFYDNRRVYYVNGRFIAKARQAPIYYSLDGINWTARTTGAADGYAFCWTGTYYITASAGSSGTVKVCTVDTLNSWSSHTSIGNSTQALAYGEYGDNKYIVAVCEGAIKYITADDFEVVREWTSLYSGANKFYNIEYHNGKFVAVGLGCSAVIDITGSTPTLTLKGNITAQSIVYVNGVYYAIGYFTEYPSAPEASNSLYYIKEEDLLTATDWSTYTLPETLAYSAVVTDGQKLILNDNGHAYFVKVDVGGEVFTLEAEPTTESTVYSEPEVESALTITSVGTGTITLSDTFTYDYTSADNQEVTHTVAESYPDVMCNITEVGLKKGNDFIATNTPDVAFTGTDGTTDGSKGMVPAPTIADTGKYLSSDGTWKAAETTYDTTNPNPISAVAIQNGNFLRDLTSSQYSLGILTSFAASESIAIGKLSQAGGIQSVSLGYSAIVEGTNSIGIGRGAIVPNGSCIQLGRGTNSNTYPSFNVGFCTDNDSTPEYTLLDGRDGTIPSERIKGEELNVKGVINQNTAVGAKSPLQIWEGTEAEWNNGGIPTPYYAWSDGMTSSGTMPYSDAWYTVAYGNNTFITMNKSVGYSANSANGTSWTLSQVYSSLQGTDFRKIIFANNSFIAVQKNGRYVYSTDGQTWTDGGQSTGGTQGYAICYGNGYYVNYCSTTNRIYYTTTLGSAWTNYTSRNDITSFNFQAGTYGEYNGNGYFMFVGSENNTKAILFNKNDFPTQTSATITKSYSDLGLTSSRAVAFNDVAYGNGKFVAVGPNQTSTSYAPYGGNCVFTVDITGATPVYSVRNNAPATMGCCSICYGAGTFFAVGSCSSSGTLSIGASNKVWCISDADVGNPNVAWKTISLPATDNWSSVTFGDNKLVVVANNSSNSAVIDFAAGTTTYYTTDSEPTVSSIVYEDTTTQSALTVTSYTDGVLSLSDGNSYEYNPVGLILKSNSVGQSYPNMLAFIEGVGVKIGTTVISEVAGS